MSATTKQFIKYQIKETKENKMFLLMPGEYKEAINMKQRGCTITEIFDRLTGKDPALVDLITIKQEIV